jgi:hypothetical protein
MRDAGVRGAVPRRRARAGLRGVDVNVLGLGRVGFGVVVVVVVVEVEVGDFVREERFGGGVVAGGFTSGRVRRGEGRATHVGESGCV